MPWLQHKGATLLDTIGNWPTEWWLVYRDIDHDHWIARAFHRFLKPGFQHVQALRRDGRVWVSVYPHMEFVDVHLIRSDATPWQLYPCCTIQHVVTMRDSGRMYSTWHVGPWTCVEVVKSLLGIRRFWLRTPRQLYQHLGGKHHGQQTQGTKALKGRGRAPAAPT